MFGKEKKPKDLLNAAKNGTLETILAQVPEENRQRLLNNALYDAVDSKKTSAEVPAAALLEAGADPNAVIFKFNGIILAHAVRQNQPPSVIKLLYDYGASFEDASFLMQMNDWTYDNKDRLDTYRRKLEKTPPAYPKKEATAVRQETAPKQETAQPVTEGASPPVTEEALLKVLDLVQELRDQMTEMTGRMDTLAEEVETVKTAQQPQSQKRPTPAPFKSAAPTR